MIEALYLEAEYQQYIELDVIGDTTVVDPNFGWYKKKNVTYPKTVTREEWIEYTNFRKK